MSTEAKFRRSIQRPPKCPNTPMWGGTTGPDRSRSACTVATIRGRSIRSRGVRDFGGRRGLLWPPGLERPLLRSRSIRQQRPPLPRSSVPSRSFTPEGKHGVGHGGFVDSKEIDPSSIEKQQSIRFDSCCCFAFAFISQPFVQGPLRSPLHPPPVGKQALATIVGCVCPPSIRITRSLLLGRPCQDAHADLRAAHPLLLLLLLIYVGKGGGGGVDSQSAFIEMVGHRIKVHTIDQSTADKFCPIETLHTPSTSSRPRNTHTYTHTFLGDPPPAAGSARGPSVGSGC